MKLSPICTASILFGASLVLVHAQGRPGGRGPGGPGPDGPPPEGERPPTSEIVKHISERFAAIASYDTSGDGKLDAAEQAEVAKAIDEGKLELGPPGPPRKGNKDGKGKGEGKGDHKPGGKPGGPRPPSDVIAGEMAKMYESLAVYDTKKDGSLDAEEQAAVVKAIDDGTLKLPRPGGPGGPRRGGPRPEGGRPGPRPEGE